jgi:hypothetical protein
MKRKRGKELFDYFFTFAEHGYFLDAWISLSVRMSDEKMQ